MSNGKGDTPRPLSVDTETYKSNWEQTFGNTPEKARTRISESLHEIQEEINRLRDIVDNCEYSGLPSTHSYGAHGESL
jgi:tetrahydromethanopterin S-methyltransferase subunit B